MCGNLGGLSEGGPAILEPASPPNVLAKNHRGFRQLLRESKGSAIEEQILLEVLTRLLRGWGGERVGPRVGAQGAVERMDLKGKLNSHKTGWSL